MAKIITTCTFTHRLLYNWTGQLMRFVENHKASEIQRILVLLLEHLEKLYRFWKFEGYNLKLGPATPYWILKCYWQDIHFFSPRSFPIWIQIPNGQNKLFLHLSSISNSITIGSCWPIFYSFPSLAEIAIFCQTGG